MSVAVGRGFRRYAPTGVYITSVALDAKRFLLLADDMVYYRQLLGLHLVWDTAVCRLGAPQLIQCQAALDAGGSMGGTITAGQDKPGVVVAV